MKVTIGKKLMLSFGGMLAITLGLAYGALSSIGTLSGALDSALTRTAKKLDLASDMEGSANDLIAGQRGVMLFSMLKDPAKVEKAKAIYESNMQDVEKDLAEVAPLLNTERGRRAIETVRTGIGAWKPVFQEMERMSAAGRFSEMNGLIERAANLGAEVKQASADLQQFSRSSWPKPRRKRAPPPRAAAISHSC